MPDDPTKQEQHVTELAGPDDRWVSVTDASRIARRQEHTIRTWIAQGILPVNPVRVGMNKKTRQVRLSDLSKLTPIIDPDAGIATDLGTLDLPSIPKQQQQVMEQMAVLQREVTGELGRLSTSLQDLIGKHEWLDNETQKFWLVNQQQYQALTRCDHEHQQQLQQMRSRLTEQDASYSQKLQQTRQELNTLVTATEDALRLSLFEQVGHSEAILRQAVEAAQAISMEAIEQVRETITGVEVRLANDGDKLREVHEKLAVEVSRLHAHTDQQFSQVANRIDPVETTLGKLQDELLKQAGHVGQLETEVLTRIGTLATQMTQWQSAWQERARAAEEEVRQLRHTLDVQERFQHTLQKQLDEECKAREELSLKVGKLLQQNQ